MDLKERLKKEITRDPTFNETYPPVVDIDFAVEVAIERIEEWSYTEDMHGWCHERPILITLVKEVLDAQT